MWRRITALAVLLVLVPILLHAQSAGGVVVVRVRDSVGGAVPLATVIAESEGLRQLRTTNDSGRATFTLPRDATIRVSVRRIGYIPIQTTLAVQSERQTVELTIGRAIAFSLDTVRVTAQRAVRGLVVAKATQEPIAGALIKLTGSSQRVTSAADGSFTLPLRVQRSVTLTVRARGYAPAFRTERLDDGASGDFLVLLDTLGAVPNRVIANLWDAEMRISWRSVVDATVGGRELRATGAAGVLDALRLSRSSSERGLRVGDSVCLFVNGEAAPGQTLETFSVESVTMVELYERGGEMIRSLADRWPKNAPCGRGPSAVAPSGPGAVRYAVVWTY